MCRTAWCFSTGLFLEEPSQNSQNQCISKGIREMKEYFRSLLKALGRFLYPWSRRINKFDDLVFVETYRGSADLLKPNALALVGTPENFKWLQLVCPCGCREIIAMNLMKKYHPHWTVDVHEDATITVFPSIHASKCGAHFWVRRNHVQWC